MLSDKTPTDYISVSFKIPFVFSVDILVALVLQVECNVLSTRYLSQNWQGLAFHFNKYLEFQ